MTIQKATTAANGGEAADYILDMLGELAQMARRNDERVIAIHLEAIIAASKALEQKLAARRQ